MAAKDIEAAVRAWQLYMGKGLRCRIRDEQKLYNRAVRLTQGVAERRKMDPIDAEQRIIAEARRRGGICPIPGKDI